MLGTIVMPVRAAVLSIGDELTLGQIAESNAAWIAQLFLRRGLVVIEHRTVEDDRAAIADAMVALASRADVLVVTGGLGPTDDDLTREALADALGGVELVEDPQAREALRLRFEGRGRTMPSMNAKQALRPAGTTCIANLNGTAPGLEARIGSAVVFCLPGPPNEMQPMFRASVLGRTAGSAVVTCAVHSCGLPESVAAERIRHLMDRGLNPLVGTTASGAVVSARIRATGSAARDGSVERVAQEIERAWAPFVFGRDETTLAEALGEILRKSGDRVAVAESCTGGGVGEFMTSAAGSSDWFCGGWITYSDNLKSELLGVPANMIREHGAVSEQVACAMALGAAIRANSRFGVSTTGIAGPGGASHEKPVGTVWIAVADRSEPAPELQVRARCFLQSGDRQTVRARTARIAAQCVRLVAMKAADASLLFEVQAKVKTST